MASTSDPDPLAPVFEQHERRRLRSLLEAAIFASPEPVTVPALARALQESEALIRALLHEITEHFEQPEHGLLVHRTATGYRLGTKPVHHAELKEMLRHLRPRPPLSAQSLQTLAIIAYKQPVSASQIQAIRGVEGAGVLATLRKHKLIRLAGRSKHGGHALLYQTTELFLKDFGLQSLKDLPALEKFAEIRAADNFPKPA
jgi:segregation and condensation protein B